MKYNDQQTLRSHIREIEKETQNMPEYWWGSNMDRKSRRRKERLMENFYQTICKYVDKDWWDCVSINDKYQMWVHWEDIKRQNKNNANIIDFINLMKDKVKIDTSLYRDKKIEKVLK